jgi:hypothetical protein
MACHCFYNHTMLLLIHKVKLHSRFRISMPQHQQQQYHTDC